MPNYFTDVNAKNLPLDMKINNIRLDTNVLNGFLCISFFDHDSITNHDYLGGVCRTLQKNNQGTEPQVLNIDFEGISFTINYHYER